MTEQDFIDEFGITIEQAMQIVLTMTVANQQDWDELIKKCLVPDKPTPRYFMAYHARRMKTMQMLKRLGYEVH